MLVWSQIIINLGSRLNSLDHVCGSLSSLKQLILAEIILEKTKSGTKKKTTPKISKILRKWGFFMFYVGSSGLKPKLTYLISSFGGWWKGGHTLKRTDTHIQRMQYINDTDTWHDSFLVSNSWDTLYIPVLSVWLSRDKLKHNEASRNGPALIMKSIS